VLPKWADEQHLRSIVVVAATDHSRRLQRVFDRATKGHPTHVTVQAARYSSFDPDRWWETRSGTRIEIIELQKRLLDIVLQPNVILTWSLSIQRQKVLSRFRAAKGAAPSPPVGSFKMLSRPAGDGFEVRRHQIEVEQSVVAGHRPLLTVQAGAPSLSATDACGRRASLAMMTLT
jgi:hypothetical protein